MKKFIVEENIHLNWDMLGLFVCFPFSLCRFSFFFFFLVSFRVCLQLIYLFAYLVEWVAKWKTTYSRISVQQIACHYLCLGEVQKLL